jgi:hypothetical protein
MVALSRLYSAQKSKLLFALSMTANYKRRHWEELSDLTEANIFKGRGDKKIISFFRMGFSSYSLQGKSHPPVATG